MKRIQNFVGSQYKRDTIHVTIIIKLTKLLMCEMVMINDHDHQDHRDRQDHRDHHCDPHDTDNQILTV